MRYALLFLALASVALCDSNAPKPQPEAQPISTELRAKFWRAIAEQQSTKAAFERAVENAKAVQEAIKKACGGSAIVMDANGEPACEVTAK